MANTTPTPPFTKSAPPPPLLIVLLGNTDLILDPLPTLLSREDLPLKHTHSRSNHVCFHPYKYEESSYSFFIGFFWLTIGETGQGHQRQVESSAMAAAMDSMRAESAMDCRSPLSSASSSPRATPTPESSQIPGGNTSKLTKQPQAFFDDASPLSSALTSPSATPAPESPKKTVCVSKIRKPQPKGAGRECLTDIVTLNTSLLEKIKVCPSCQSQRLQSADLSLAQDDVHKLMHKYLNTSVCLSSQDKDKLNMIWKQVCSWTLFCEATTCK